MNMTKRILERRSFLKTSFAVSAGLTGMMMFPKTGFANPADPDPGLTIIGPREGYTPQIGTLVSMMAFCRSAVVRSVKGLSPDQLDFLLDDKANSIGALLYHLAALDAIFNEITFKGVEWGKWDDSFAKKYEVAMNLGDPARKAIKGNSLDFYLNLLQATRETTLAEFKKRDDQWMMIIDKTWAWGPTNNYCKWFHVCEHESHHQGQIALIKTRVPGIKSSNE
jgi:uncharacterized damage-inducible protein DinB